MKETLHQRINTKFIYFKRLRDNTVIKVNTDPKMEKGWRQGLFWHLSIKSGDYWIDSHYMSKSNIETFLERHEEIPDFKDIYH